LTICCLYFSKNNFSCLERKKIIFAGLFFKNDKVWTDLKI
jgi:hypothetical protein